MKLTKTWHTGPSGLALRMSLEVEGEVLNVTHIQNNDQPYYQPSPPIKYVERDMRHRLMRALEDRIFKDVR